MNVNVTLYLDTRREKSENKYPVKLRVYFNTVTKQYKTGIDVTENEFFNAYQSKKPRKEFKDLRIKLYRILNEADEIASKIEPFSFEKFERKMNRGKGDENNVFYYYNQYIEQLRNEERAGTLSNYDISLKSIKKFVNKDREKESQIETLSFFDVTPDFLSRYEKWMLSEGRSLTTVGINIRPLRAIFNIALQEGNFTIETYPFGKRKYQIPAGRKVKKVLSKADLKTLYTFKVPKDSPQVKARDLWFFSYQCNGMNIRDIAELRYKDIQGDKIVFTRNKTKNTNKANSKPIIVPITDLVKKTIKQYGNPKLNEQTYVFPVFTDGMNQFDKLKKIQNFAKFINQHIKNLAEAAGLPADISTYWARHSFTTNAIQSGASMEFIQESLGHQDMKTTMNYWGGFEESVKRGISETLMDFVK
jgi:integrase/recombinase XerD